MPAHSETFPWPSYYGNYSFFENRIRTHSKVRSLSQIEKGLYEITLNDGRVLRVFICDCYSYDLAEYIETVENLGEVDAVIINSNWCGYTLDAKSHCIENQVGLFNISGFMSAINRERFWEVMTDYERKQLSR